jgi:hypothetical protein
MVPKQCMQVQCVSTIAVPKRCMQVQCPDKYYSEIGTIIYAPSDTVARILFDRTLLPENDLSPFPLRKKYLGPIAKYQTEPMDQWIVSCRT